MNAFGRLLLPLTMSAAVAAPVSGQAQSCPTPQGMDVLVLIDNSGSISNDEYAAAQQAVAGIASEVLGRPGYRMAAVNWACTGFDEDKDGCRLDLATGSAIPGGWSSNPADFAYAGDNSPANGVCRSFGYANPADPGNVFINRSNCGQPDFTTAISGDYAQHALKMLDGALFSGGPTGGTDSSGAATVAPSAPSQRLMIIYLTDAVALNNSRIREVPNVDAALGDYYYSNRLKNVRNALIVGVGINDTTFYPTAQQELGALSSKGGTSNFYDAAHQTAASTLAYDTGTPRLATFSSTFSAASILTAVGNAFDVTPPACVVLRKQTVGGQGTFGFTGGTNGLPASLSLTTTAPDSPVGAAYNLDNFNTDTSITETVSPGWEMSDVSCVDASDASVPVASNPATGLLTIPAARIVSGAKLTCTVTNTAVAPPQPDFGTCDARMFLDQSSGAVSRLYDVGYATAPFTFDLLGTGAARNAIGYSPQDNYIYGISSIAGINNHLIRVGADGSGVDLGEIAGLPAVNYNAGVIAPNGDFYVKAAGNNGTLYRIDIAARTATAITLSGTFVFADLAWYDGRLYAISSGFLRSITLSGSTGTVTSVGSSSPLGVASVMWGFDNGLYANDGGSGIFYLNPATGAATLMSSVPPSTNADGANCPSASLMLDADLSVTKTNTPASGPDDLPDDTYTAGGTRTYTIVVTNNGPFGAHDATVSDPLPAGITAATWTCTGTGGGACTASGSGPINDATVSLPPNATVTYQLTLTVPTDYTGDLSNTATVTPGPATRDIDMSNNTATDTDPPVPMVTLRKISLGGVDSFGFSGTNGIGAQTLTTTIVGTPVAGAAQALAAAASATTITEDATPAAYRVTDITCTGLGAGGTAVPDLANRTVVLDAAATAAGADIECTFTNTLQQTDIQVVKTASPDPVVSGDVVTYQIVVTNNGPLAADDAVLSDVAGAGQDCSMPGTMATCTATGGANCPAPLVPASSLLGSGVTIPSLPVGGQVTFGLQCTVTASGL